MCEYPNCLAGTMEAMMLCLLKEECVTLSENLNNLDEVVNSISKSVTSRWEGSLHEHYVETSAYGSDGTLLEINFLVTLFQADHCKKIRDLQQRLIADSRLFYSLVHFLGEQKYLLGYSACKALVAYLIHDTSRSDKLKYLVHWFTVDDDKSASDESESCYHRILLTFDLFRFLFKKQHLTERKPSCSCGEIETSTWVDPETDMLEAMSSLIKVLDLFELCFKETQVKLDGNPASVLGNQDMKCLKWMSTDELDMLLLSFLKVIKAFIKGTHREPYPTLLLDIVNFLVTFVKEGLQISRQTLKTCFDILTMVLELQVKGSAGEAKKLHMLQSQTAHSLCELINGEWPGRLPFSTGPVGFGGVNFIETCPHQMGDLTLLRKLTKLTLLSVHIITKEAATEENVSYLTCSAGSLGNLRTFTASVMSDVSLDTDEDWITKLFADEDEMMVSVLFLALQIYTQVARTSTGSHGNSSAVPAWCELQQLLCPHRLFFAYMKFLDFDHSVLLDLLMSCETNFLEYFTSHLHLMKHEWDKCGKILMEVSEEKEFSQQEAETDSEDFEMPPKKKMKQTYSSLGEILSGDAGDGTNLAPAGDQLLDKRCCLDDGGECNVLLRETMSNPKTAGGTENESIVANHALDRVMSAFIRLRMSLERLQKRNMFPYAITPLVRLLQDLEDVYECQ